MNKFVNVMMTEDSKTYNGAITNSTSFNACLDLFFLAGACRKESDKNIISKLSAAYQEDRVKCLKIIFWAGDIRQGAGERRFFKLALNGLNKNHKEDIQDYLAWIPEMSRWDVLFELVDNKIVFSYILSVLLDKTYKGYPLLCKWLPRKNQHNNLAHKIQKALNINAKLYRKMIVEGTKVVEQQMCSKKWNEIEYSKVPSVAMNKYNKAWYRNDQDRFEKYLEEVRQGKSKINASAIFPHDIIKSAIKPGWYTTYELNEAKILQWNSLPNYLEGKANSIIPVCDVSGSMECNHYLPISISIALGLYISERNEGPFKDAFITFSARPVMQYLKGDINARVEQLARSKWGSNTNLTAVFDLILKKAVDNHLHDCDIPKTVLVISDMEFDYCGEMTNFNYIKKAFETYGYTLPQIVFWNVNGRVGNVPVKMNDEGVALISGASPSLLKAVLTNEIHPIKMMNSVIETERYNFIR